MQLALARCRKPTFVDLDVGQNTISIPVRAVCTLAGGMLLTVTLVCGRVCWQRLLLSTRLAWRTQKACKSKRRSVRIVLALALFCSLLAHLILRLVVQCTSMGIRHPVPANQ